mmetsp:Transcript_8298/g.9802  ORF Transcript_8298/g.9802 Transcript_8298/m.9802 type:complete len:81 (-) Transcript_8298:140-382(-)
MAEALLCRVITDSMLLEPLLGRGFEEAIEYIDSCSLIDSDSDKDDERIEDVAVVRALLASVGARKRAEEFTMLTEVPEER